MYIESKRLIITEFTPDMASAVQENSVDEDNKKYVPDEVWDKICINSFGDKCSECSFRHKCEYSLMRERIRNNDEIVICNQNMLVSHFIKEESGEGIFKPDFSTLVVDEAHNLENNFRDAFTTAYSQKEISNEVLKATENRKNILFAL